MVNRGVYIDGCDALLNNNCRIYCMICVLIYYIDHYVLWLLGAPCLNGLVQLALLAPIWPGSWPYLREPHFVFGVGVVVVSCCLIVSLF